MSGRTSETIVQVPVAVSEVDVAERVLQRVLEEAERLRRFPESTYRLQFHKGFTFQDAAAIAPYLRKLGITHVYASPYLKARPGSTHGYDVMDHTKLNPELGTEADFETFLAALQREGLSHILDTVPNHAGVGTNDNAWWNDVLEFGRNSRFAEYFDIAWDGSPRPELHGKVLLPVLGEPYAKALESGQLKLEFEGGSFSVTYGDRRFPIQPATYSMILQEVVANQADWTALIRQAGRLPIDSRTADEHYRAATEFKQRLSTLAQQEVSVADAIRKAVELFNGTPGKPASFDRLDHLLMKQAYRLTYWKNAPDEINYRRFFDIDDLAALNMQRRDVFEATHRLTLSLAAAGKVTGLRIDHPDGLHDPAGYFFDLQRGYLLAIAERAVGTDPEFSGVAWDSVRTDVEKAVTQLLRHPTAKKTSGQTHLDKGTPARWPLYVLGEKILAVGEALPLGWAVHGTSGYDFLVETNSLFVDPAAEKAFTQTYAAWVGEERSYSELVYQKKKLILSSSMASELQMLAYRLDRLAQMHRSSRDFTHNVLRNALKELVACFPVYRTYICQEGSCATDAEQVDKAIACARARNPGMDESVFSFIWSALLGDGPAGATSELQTAQRVFAGRFQQLTAPVTAKGVEDTAFYLYNRFVSLNEVGGDPGRFGIEAEALHAFFRSRAAHWPFAMSTLSTHDTKRSEDVRARLNALSELNAEWQEALRQWDEVALKYRGKAGETAAPSRNDEYLIYQTLLGVWPIAASADEETGCLTRVQAYLQKAVREGKVHSSWTSPNTAYEQAMARFVEGMIRDADFRCVFRPLLEKVGRLGRLNSLSQTLLRLTAPGVPDTYQGTEFLDFSLVDPDNRRPVDYGRRVGLLDEMANESEAHQSLTRYMLASPKDGRAKLLVTWRALSLRREYPGLFTQGEYEPVRADGLLARHVFAFVRRRGPQTALVIAPRMFSAIEKTGWGDTTVHLPRADWWNVMTGERVQTDGATSLTALLAGLPIGLFVTR